MTRRATSTVASLETELTCPECAYSLTGLVGAVVCCPECGRACDRAALITGRWPGAWHAVPGYSRLCLPVAWLTMGMLATFSISVWTEHGAFDVTAPFVAGGVIVVGWLALLLWSRRVISVGSGLLLSLLAHLLLAGYLVAVIIVLWAIVTTVRVGLPGGAPFLGVAFVGVALIWGCRRGERFIAGRCMREHLLRAASGHGRQPRPAVYDAAHDSR